MARRQLSDADLAKIIGCERVVVEDSDNPDFRVGLAAFWPDGIAHACSMRRLPDDLDGTFRRLAACLVFWRFQQQAEAAIIHRAELMMGGQ